MNAMNRNALMQYVSEISLAVFDTLLFLDTHPDDRQALNYYREALQKRREAVEEFERLYGPLTVGSPYAISDNGWQWIERPWPWEGGTC